MISYQFTRSLQPIRIGVLLYCQRAVSIRAGEAGAEVHGINLTADQYFYLPTYDRGLRGPGMAHLGYRPFGPGPPRSALHAYEPHPWLTCLI